MQLPGFCIKRLAGSTGSLPTTIDVDQKGSDNQRSEHYYNDVVRSPVSPDSSLYPAGN